MESLLEVADLKIASRVTIRKEFVGLNVNTIILNWEASTLCGIPKVKKVAHLCPSPNGAS